MTDVHDNDDDGGDDDGDDDGEHFQSIVHLWAYRQKHGGP